MTTQLLEFSLKHFGLISAIATTLCALGIVEYLQWALGSQAISPTRATLLMNRRRATVLDLREKSEFLKAHLPEAIHVDKRSQEACLRHLTPAQPIIFITAQSMPPLHILKQLRAIGCSELYHLKGGILAWEESHLPMIRSLLES